MKKLEDIAVNVEQIKKKGFEYFKANVKDLIKRKQIGYMEQGEIHVPSDAQIKDRYEQITGFKVDKPVKDTK
jgi:hypothetical protein